MDRPAPHRFLVAPLDWGLGHATRCIPIIRALLAHGQEVVVAAQGGPARLLGDEFPALRIVPIVNYGITYGRSGLGTVLRYPLMAAQVARAVAIEERQVRRIVAEERIDAIISDNRYGCRCRTVRHNVYVSHQLCIRLPRPLGWLRGPLWAAHRAAIARFSEVWVPDFPGEENLSGDLSHGVALPAQCRFVGPLSRFGAAGSGVRVGPALDLLVMLSGPEPQRSVLERRVLAELEGFQGTAVVLLGRPGEAGRAGAGSGVKVLAHASGAEVLDLLTRAQAVVCRGGYTTIMELASLGKRAVLVPTPGQPEQAYLCERLAKMGRCVVRPQDRLDLGGALRALAALPEPKVLGGGEMLEEAVGGLIEAVVCSSRPVPTGVKARVE
jgi:hypothetical protein